MATTLLGNLQALDAISINTVSESSAIAVPQHAMVMTISADQVLQVRLAASGNVFANVAPRTAAHSYELDVSSLWGKNIYLYNPTGSTAAVVVGFKLRRAV